MSRWTDNKCNVTTGEARLSYVHLLEPYAFNEGDEKKYSVTLLIPKSDTATMQRIRAAEEAAAERGVSSKWGGKRPARLDSIVHDGDEDEAEENHGCWRLSASNKSRVQVLDANVQPIIDPLQVYSGCYGRAMLTFYPYGRNGHNGVSASLQGVQVTRDGEPLGSAPADVADVFGPVSSPAQDPLLG